MENDIYFILKKNNVRKEKHHQGTKNGQFRVPFFSLNLLLMP